MEAQTSKTCSTCLYFMAYDWHSDGDYHCFCERLGESHKAERIEPDWPACQHYQQHPRFADGKEARP